jgi:putative membrane protein
MKSTAFAATLALTLPLLATTSVSALAVTTEEFVNKVTISDMFEVKSGKLAAKKAKHEDVKDFGEQMVDDHTETTEDLKELVKDENIKVDMPSKLDDKHQSNLEKLKEVSGAKFDTVYVPMQVLAHEQAANLFEDYSKSGDNEALKEWAADTVPTLKEHLEEARDLNAELSKTAETAAADDKAIGEDKAMDKSAADEKKTMEKVTDKTDVDGAGNMAMNEKAENKNADNADKAADRKAPPPSFEYVIEQAPSDWTAQSLIGKSVENNSGETLGEVNNVIVNEKGKVVAITVGVGGFLGLGEKDVGVPFEALKFETAGDAAEDSETGSQATNEEKEKADEASRLDSDHSNMQIVIDATKEQLEAAPSFVWLDEKRDKRADVENETDTAVE